MLRVLQVGALVCLPVALAGASAGRSPGTLPPPRIRSNPAWLTVTTHQPVPQVFALTAGSNPDALVPFDGLDKLDARGALIMASTLRRGGFRNAFAPAAWPPRLADFRIDRGWEGQPEVRIQQRLLGLTTAGWSLDVRVYFGTQHPSKTLLASVQVELNRLTLPSK